MPYAQPGYAHSFFLSHASEDVEEVIQLRKAVDRRGSRKMPPRKCFLDQANWPKAKPIIEVIRDTLLRCEFFVAWITPAYLRSSRGWVWVEFTYAQLIEQSLNIEPFHFRYSFILPVFRGVSLQDVEKTPWLSYWNRPLVSVDDGVEISGIADRLVAARVKYLQERQ